jgi:hypothetical protein
LADYYDKPPTRDRTYSHSLTSALCAAEMLSNPNQTVADVYKHLNSKYHITTELNEYLNAK